MKRITLIVLSVALAASVALAPAAQAAKSYANCTQLHHRYHHGVAKSKGAANREVQNGYGYPKVSRRLYRANSTLDANNDGVACED